MIRRCGLALLLAQLGCVADPVAPAADLATADLATADLVTADLVTVDLATADLATDLTAVDLTEADLTAADLGPPSTDLLPPPPTWIESNQGLLGASLLNLAVAEDVIYVSNLYDVYKSTDDGQTFVRVPLDWESVQEGIGSIAAHESYLYVGLTRGRVLRVEGTAVTEITGSPFTGTKPPITSGVDHLEVERLPGSQVLYVSDGTGVYEFNGAALVAPEPKPDPWRKLSALAGFPVAQTIYRMRVTADGVALYVAATAGLLKLSAGSWSVDDAPGERPLHLDVIGNAPAPHIAVLTYSGNPIYYNGASWEIPLANIGGTAPTLISEGDDGSLVTTSLSGIHRLAARSDDDWSLVYPTSKLFVAMARSLDRTRLYMTAELGLFRADSDAIDVGAFSIGGLHGVSIEQLVASPTNVDRLYAATNHGLFFSTDAGASWAAVADTQLATAQILGLALASGSSNDVVYAIAAESLFRSTDGGATFFDLAWPTAAVATDPVNDAYVFVCRGSQLLPDQPFVSGNQGDDFVVYQGSPNGCGALTFGGDGTLYVAASNALWKATQPLVPTVGLTFVATITGEDVAIRNLLPVPQSNDLLALTGHLDPTNRQIYRIQGSISTLQAGPVSAGGYFAISVSPADPTRLWVAGENGVYVGTLGVPQPFTEVSNGLPGGGVRALLQSRTEAARLWVGIEERGLYRAQ